MTFPTKPGVDWDEIQRRWESGETSGNLCKDYDITRQAIDKKAKKRGWRRNDEPGAKWLPATKATSTAKRIEDPKSRSDQLIKAHGKRTPENMAYALDLAEMGMSQNRIAEAIGFSDTLLARWLEDDKDFGKLWHQASATFERDRLGVIDTAAFDNKDWRAAAWRLEKAPRTKETYSEARHGGGQVNITLNIDRGIPKEIQGDIIDAEVTA